MTDEMKIGRQPRNMLLTTKWEGVWSLKLVLAPCSYISRNFLIYLMSPTPLFLLLEIQLLLLFA